MSEEEIMNEYEILKDQLFNERETYNFIDKLGYDDWNKKQVIREYIKHIRDENQQLKEDVKDLDNQKEMMFKNMQLNQLKVCELAKVLDEIREYINKCWFIEEGEKVVFQEDIEEILDKVKE